MPLILPNDIANGQPIDGDKLQQNFATIESWGNQEAITRDGNVAMTQPLLLAGPPTNPNQAATKAYADGVVWCKGVNIGVSGATGGQSDYPLDFGPSPITGVGAVHISVYVGFAPSPGQALVLAYTNEYNAPGGGGFITQQSAWTPLAAGAWEPTATVTLLVSAVTGVAPSVVLRLRYDTPSLSVTGNAVIQAMPGAW